MIDTKGWKILANSLQYIKGVIDQVKGLVKVETKFKWSFHFSVTIWMFKMVSKYHEFMDRLSDQSWFMLKTLVQSKPIQNMFRILMVVLISYPKERIKYYSKK